MLLVVLGLFVISMAGSVSAFTDVVGVVYNEDYSETIADANVTIDCNGNVKSVLSKGDGRYGVEYYVSKCGNGDNVTVIAEKDGLISNPGTGVVHNFGLEVYVAIINVSMVPEFGAVLGIMSLLGAVGIFFIIRRE